MADLERRLVRKLDRSAFSNAYVSGLKEHLNLVGNQYSILIAMFTAGSVVNSR
ncbi:hypothetical protein SNOG_09078 [Parastagonospora nodorum SN15]|uniref:Uncharacterized protein n=1 Tax=Phaeosphaeria nodorum (strain SN15 / ATCC MYA-4574 / FGSC 10173) TaxID=321614 RepID=Q0UGN6_PHANO|nr:hypothetical protein SNOG_09078 [Parastagonospora nodorum SN15]EAT83270.1 hypothetical protein SNOG_09078 [Parastagonospora nodorum SN15]